MQLELFRGKCRSCSSPVSHFALRCPHCGGPNQPNPVVTIAALAGALVTGAVVVGSAFLMGTSGPQQEQVAQTAAPRADRSPSSPAAGNDSGEYSWLVQAMSGCDEQAKRNADALHFLIVPVTSTGSSIQGWSPDPIADVGTSAKLLSSSDALTGLRNHALTIYQRPLIFAVEDPKTSTVYKWKPAVGVAALNATESDFDSLKLGFELPDVTDAVAWSPVIRISKDKCYWINVLVLTPGSK